jgi:4-amino-4-deoxy-L-arabinose transferase-like glycosyltransferase
VSAGTPAQNPGTAFRHQSWISVVLSMLAAAAVLLPLLGHKALADWDEGIYAEVSREFLGRSWLVPHWHFQPWFEKPPLDLWLTAVFFRIFGVNEFWARAVSALSSIGIVAVVHAVALRVRGVMAAWIATFILLSSFGFLRVARMGELDALLTLGCIVALWGLAKVRDREPAGWYWFWTGFALAAMTKGAASITLLLTLLIAVAWNRWGWRHLDGQFLAGPFLGGLGIFALLVLPWHLYMLHSFGRAFLDEYLGLHVIARATGQIEGHATPWWFYGKVLAAYTSPWLILFPFALRWQARRPKMRQDLREWLVFAAVVLIFFSAMATRSPKYIFPAYPALALITGDWLAAQLEHRSRKFRTRFLWTAGLGTLAAYGVAAAVTRPLRQSLTTTHSATGAVLHADREPETLLLAALRSPEAGGVSGPVLLCQEDTVAQLPSLLFAVRRPLQQVYLVHSPDTLEQARRYADPEPLRNFVGPSPRLILIAKPLVAGIPADMEFHPIATGNTLEAGTIQIAAKR